MACLKRYRSREHPFVLHYMATVNEFDGEERCNVMYIFLGTMHEQTISDWTAVCLFYKETTRTKSSSWFSFDGNFDNLLQVSGAQVATLKHHKSPVRDCSWHPFNTMLVSSSWDGDVVKWEFAGSGDRPASLNKRVWTRHFYDEYMWCPSN